MDDIPLGVLIGALFFLLLLSAFFSSSETGLMTLNRYRLRHLAKAGHPGALRAERLLQNPDRLIGLILIGNNLVNIMASSLVTIIALRTGAEHAVAIGVGALTLVVLIFAEVAPKTFAALHPERIAFPAAYVYGPLLKLMLPVVWLVNMFSNQMLRIMRLTGKDGDTHTLSSEELRTVVNEAGAMIPRRHQKMLLSILDLENVTVEDIMIPRTEIAGIDLDDSWDDIETQLEDSPYTKLPVFRGSIDHVEGFLHLRNVIPFMTSGELNMDDITKVIREPYFIPEGTPLNTQLLNFQREKRRFGLVVDEYGDIQGLVTLEDILEEIVGEFTSDPSSFNKDIHPQEDGSYLIDGTAHIRDINRALGWTLPANGPKTLSGLIIEHMETIPESGTSLLLHGHPVEILQTMDNVIKTARIDPQLQPRETGNDEG